MAKSTPLFNCFIKSEKKGGEKSTWKGRGGGGGGRGGKKDAVGLLLVTDSSA